MIFYIDYGGGQNPNIRDYYISHLDSLPYLNKINIGTSELLVYENKNYKPYVYGLSSLVSLTSLKNLSEKYTFITNTLNRNFDFIITDKTKSIPSTDVINIFEDLTPSNIQDRKISIDLKKTIHQTYSIQTTIHK